MTFKGPLLGIAVFSSLTALGYASEMRSLNSLPYKTVENASKNIAVMGSDCAVTFQKGLERWFL